MKKKMKPVSGIPPTWIDDVAMTLGKPWVFVLAFGFLIIPSHLLVAALNSGAAFLKIGTGARPTAMGGAYTAVANDVDAMYYNPGGLARISKRELGATHTKWLLDTTFDFVGYAQPTDVGTFGLGFTRLAAGKQQTRNADRQVTGSYEASDSAYTMSYSRVLRPGTLFANGSTSVGVNLKLLHSRIGPHSARSTAFDLGLQHQAAGKPLSVGFSVLNVGRGMKFIDQVDPLPLTFSAGAAYRLGGALNIALDVRHEPHENQTGVGIGTEYAVLPQFSLRMGYASQLATARGGGGAMSAFGGLGAGFGIRMNNYRADYTFTPFGQLGNVQRLSLGAKF